MKVLGEGIESGANAGRFIGLMRDTMPNLRWVTLQGYVWDALLNIWFDEDTGYQVEGEMHITQALRDGLELKPAKLHLLRN